MIEYFFYFVLLFVICGFISYCVVKWLWNRPELRVCPKCGLIGGDLDYCPKCGERDIKIVNPDGSTIQMRAYGFWFYWLAFTILFIGTFIFLLVMWFFIFYMP